MSTDPFKVRFAPSPSGYLHLGNARTALMNAVIAQAHSGVFLLRYDDTDLERVKPEFAEAIAEDLTWLGVNADETIRQSERTELYDAAFADLRERGLIYPCFETPEELDRRRKRAMARGLPPIYDRAALRWTAEERKAFEAEGRRPHWRFLLPNHDGDPHVIRRTDIEWSDLVLGPQHVDLGSLSDPVLVRQDGSYLYTLPSVVDDADMGVTAVIRGADHITNTGVQIALFAALDRPVPQFGHHNLLLDAAGEGLSKRIGSLSLRELRDQGYEPEAVVGLALLTGTSEPVRAGTVAKMAASFDPGTVSASPSRLSIDELDALNRGVLHEMPYAVAKPRLDQLNADLGEGFWSAVRPNLDRFSEASIWADIVRGDGERVALEDDRTFLTEAASILPESIAADTWKEWTGDLRERTGRKGRALFMPLRQALTGLDHGPELAELLPIMKRETILQRLTPQRAK